MIQIQVADLNNVTHASAVVELLNEYAKDPMGGDEALSEYTQTHLIDEMKKRKTIYALLAFVDQQAIGLCVCVEGFSTFACKPLLNVHDMVVLKAYRGRGIAVQLLTAAKDLASEKGCCKLTLEVFSENKAAQSVYRSVGFVPYALDPAMGTAEFWQFKF